MLYLQLKKRTEEKTRRKVKCYLYHNIWSNKTLNPSDIEPCDLWSCCRGEVEGLQVLPQALGQREGAEEGDDQRPAEDEPGTNFNFWLKQFFEDHHKHSWSSAAGQKSNLCYPHDIQSPWLPGLSCFPDAAELLVVWAVPVECLQSSQSLQTLKITLF